jgi:crossover junction endodeoxyribonuclease RusA
MTKKMFSLVLPYPPSVNTYWGFKGSQRFLTSKAREFKAETLQRFQKSGLTGFGDARLHVAVYLHAPDRRIRDIDNIAKPLLDALTQCKVFEDDGQVDQLLIVRRNVIKGGACQVVIVPANPS